MDRQTVERRREYVQNIRNSFYEENGSTETAHFFICMYICSFFRLHVYPYGFVWLQHADDHRNDL